MTRDASVKSKNNSQSVRAVPCLERILSFLSQSELAKTSLVCKNWHVASSMSLWSKFKFTREREFERIFNVLSRRNTTIQYGSFISSLELIHSDREFHVNSNTIYLITSLCPNLLSIHIKFHITRPVAPPIPNHLAKKPPTPRLRPPLPFSHLPADQPSSPVAPPPKYTHTLPLAHFAYNCLKLKSIQLDSYSPKTDDSVYEMAKYMTSGTLESLQINNCSSIQSSTLCKLAITNPQLRYIEITGHTPVTDSSIATIADRCGKSLEYLSIGNGYQLTDKSMHYIASRCKQIQHLCIFNNNAEKISQDTLTAIMTHCLTLQSLSLSDSRGLGSQFFKSVVQRVYVEIENIKQHRAEIGSGLQRLCLGGVQREVIRSTCIQQLIDTSASKHDVQQADDESLTDDFIPITTTTTTTTNYNIQQQSTFFPKNTIIRGNTIWWQRRRISQST